MNATDKQLEDTSDIIRAYALMVLGFPLSFVPMGIVSSLGIALLICGVIYAYRLKKRLSETVVGKNHVQWILRTFWISSAYWAIGALIAWMVVSSNSDSTAIQHLADAMESGAASPDEITLMITEFQTKNAPLLYWSKLLSFAPCVIFFALRFIKGYRLAEDYKPVPNVKTWLI
ncbi:MAG TPA: hypothetical protein VIN59_04480 [Alphaproteobacteria bacterium]